jgi:hypothetical protein
MQPASSVEFMRKLVAALGLPPGTVKVVVECEVRQPPRVYFKGLVPADRADAVAGLFEVVPVADVTVADDCTVVATRHPNFEEQFAAQTRRQLDKMGEMIRMMGEEQKGPAGDGR